MKQKPLGHSEVSSLILQAMRGLSPEQANLKNLLVARGVVDEQTATRSVKLMDPYWVNLTFDAVEKAMDPHDAFLQCVQALNASRKAQSAIPA